MALTVYPFLAPELSMGGAIPVPPLCACLAHNGTIRVKRGHLLMTSSCLLTVCSLTKWLHLFWRLSVSISRHRTYPFLVLLMSVVWQYTYLTDCLPKFLVDEFGSSNTFAKTSCWNFYGLFVSTSHSPKLASQSSILVISYFPHLPICNQPRVFPIKVSYVSRVSSTAVACPIHCSLL